MPVGKSSQDLFPFKYDLLPFEGNLILIILSWAFEKNQLFYSDVENHVMQRKRNIRKMRKIIHSDGFCVSKFRITV